MTKSEVVSPNIKNFIKSLRDLGYSYEVAVADIIDNSIAARASIITIHTVSEPEMVFSMLDNGIGMSETELIEAMRLASKNPDELREKDDLGRFGLGLKTASFSQCRKLTVLSKKDDILSARQWDLDYISQHNEWLLITPDNYNNLPLIKELKKLKNGTLVAWETLDRCQKEKFSDYIQNLRRHLALVFHRFLETGNRFNILKIWVNNNQILPFNPFNANHPATQEMSPEKIKFFGSTINIQPFILPHHSNLSPQDYEQYATREGYVKSQGFYLYRADRLLIHGTWWGLHKAIDAHKLVRVKIDIPNDLDQHWGIDIKKSTARPSPVIKNDLKRIIAQVTEKGARPFTGRGRKIEDKTTKRFWQIVPIGNDFRFALDLQHPIYEQLISSLNEDAKEILNIYLKGLQAYLPLEAIQAKLQQSPYRIRQETALSSDEVLALAEKIKSLNLSQEHIDSLIKTELFKNHKELLQNGNDKLS
ncbi:ATP-binding protein [Desulfobacterales bacterium HSG16]|nr:ATP-binding protein [Desulfobacterales bacterium HSG16]